MTEPTEWLNIATRPFAIFLRSGAHGMGYKCPRHVLGSGQVFANCMLARLIVSGTIRTEPPAIDEPSAGITCDLLPVGRAVRRLFHPHGVIVFHDLAHDATSNEIDRANFDRRSTTPLQRCRDLDHLPTDPSLRDRWPCRSPQARGDR